MTAFTAIGHEPSKTVFAAKAAWRSCQSQSQKIKSPNNGDRDANSWTLNWVDIGIQG